MKFNTGEELIRLCTEQNKKIYEIMILRENELSGKSKQEIIAEMHSSFEIMKQAVKSGVTEDLTSISGLTGGDAKKIFSNSASIYGPVCGSFLKKAMAYAMGVLEINASMGKIVAAPTAGSSGIIPGAFIALQEEYNLQDEQLIQALFTASGVGLLISKNATVAGAEGGCQAETGSAAAMAAAGIVELMGGSSEAALHAAAIALKNILGLVCDPIAGLVESPCEKRNGLGVSNALISAEMALCGVTSIIPFDEVVEAMYKVGRSLPFELKESALGGLAATPTGEKIKRQIFNS